MEIKPIAYIKTDFKEKFGIPRQSGIAKRLTAKIIFEPEYRNPDALRGIEGFSHLWLIFDFSLSHRENWSPTVRPPRLGGNEKRGVFATRSPFRPNSLGLSCVKLLKIEQSENDGQILIVSGADLLDDTPIYDVKPYIPYADSYPEATGGFTDEITKEKLEIVFPEELLKLLPEEKRQGLIDILAEDPRPSYQNDGDRIYSMLFDRFDIHFKINENTLTVIKIDKKTAE